MNRNPLLERELLARANAPTDLAKQVVDRLDAFEVKHGNTGWEQPAAELLGEIQEECADILGWGIGAARQLDEEQTTELVIAMSLGSFAWKKIEALRQSVEC